MQVKHAHEMYKALPMVAVSRLPDEGFDVRLVNVASKWSKDIVGYNLPVYCKPKPPVGVRWGHRVMVICPCGKHVPFGRLGQHWKACDER